MKVTVKDIEEFKEIENKNDIFSKVREIIETIFNYTINFNFGNNYQELFGPIGYFGNKIRFFRDIMFLDDKLGGIMKYTKISAKIKNETNGQRYTVAIAEILVGKNVGFKFRNLNASFNNDDNYKVVIHPKNLKV